jgi:monofunctional biosynthetic peptidoglycan transglycosylase
MANHTARKLSLFRKLMKRFLYCCVAFVGLTVIIVFLLRHIAPFTSGLMIERRFESFTSDGHYARFYQWRSINNIALAMQRAVISSEDQLFMQHNGFDWHAIEQAVTYNDKKKNVVRNRIRGASTISQQTAKNLFLWSGRSWLRKGLEAYFTVLIECLWSKERILEMYLNIIEFGDGIYGVEAASQHFFGKSAEKLSASDAALLAAVLPNPHIYQVEKPSAYILGRQAWILRNMQHTSLKTLGQ